MNGGGVKVVRYFACPTCRLWLGMEPGDRGNVPWHFDRRPPVPGAEREGCPSSYTPAPEPKRVMKGGE